MPKAVTATRPAKGRGENATRAAAVNTASSAVPRESGSTKATKANTTAYTTGLKPFWEAAVPNDSTTERQAGQQAALPPAATIAVQEDSQTTATTYATETTAESTTTTRNRSL